MVLNDFFKITPEKRQVKIRGKKGVIYSNPTGWKRDGFYMGTMVFLTAIVGLIYLYQPVVESWISYQKIDQTEVEKETRQIIEKIKTEPTPTPKIYIEPEDNIFNVEIPKIGAKADIVIGVSPYDKNEYKRVLKDNVIAQSQISSLPGEGKGTSVYLFAHSSQQDISAARQNSVFYLLGELNNDDMVMINYKGKMHVYKVYMKKIIKPNQIEYLEYKEDDKEIVILQTCWPIGTNWQRLLVFAEKV